MTVHKWNYIGCRYAKRGSSVKSGMCEGFEKGDRKWVLATGMPCVRGCK